MVKHCHNCPKFCSKIYWLLWKQDLGLQCQTPLGLKAFVETQFQYVWFWKLWTVFNPTSKGVLIPFHALEIKEGVVLGPMLHFRVWTSIEIELTCKNLGPNVKNWMRFWNLKIWQNWEFASPWLTKNQVTRSIFEIEDSSSGFSLIFVQPKLSSILYPPPKGG